LPLPMFPLNINRTNAMIKFSLKSICSALYDGLWST
jgi:hypothetical protein